MVTLIEHICYKCVTKFNTRGSRPRGLSCLWSETWGIICELCTQEGFECRMPAIKFYTLTGPMFEEKNVSQNPQIFSVMGQNGVPELLDRATLSEKIKQAGFHKKGSPSAQVRLIPRAKMPQECWICIACGTKSGGYALSWEKVSGKVNWREVDTLLKRKGSQKMLCTCTEGCQVFGLAGMVSHWTRSGEPVESEIC